MNTLKYSLNLITTPDTENTRTYLPTELYLPEWARTTEFFRNICVVIDYLENSLKDVSNPKYAQIEQAYKDIGFKYKDIMQLSEDALKVMLIENGFGAILDVLELPLEKIQMLVLHLPLFKALKGTDVGFRQLLKLLSYDYEIKSWVERPTELEEYTYNMKFITLENSGFDSKIVSKLIKFSRSYVYPVLKNLIISTMIRQLSPAVYGRPIIREKLQVKCFDEPKKE